MIRHPKPGQVVKLHYAAARRNVCRFHGCIGTVQVVGRGPGPRNVLVDVNGVGVVVPAGQLREP